MWTQVYVGWSLIQVHHTCRSFLCILVHQAKEHELIYYLPNHLSKQNSVLDN